MSVAESDNCSFAISCEIFQDFQMEKKKNFVLEKAFLDKFAILTELSIKNANKIFEIIVAAVKCYLW